MGSGRGEETNKAHTLTLNFRHHITYINKTMSRHRWGGDQKILESLRRTRGTLLCGTMKYPINLNTLRILNRSFEKVGAACPQKNHTLSNYAVLKLATAYAIGTLAIAVQLDSQKAVHPSNTSNSTQQPPNSSSPNVAQTQDQIKYNRPNWVFMWFYSMFIGIFQAMVADYVLCRIGLLEFPLDEYFTFGECIPNYMIPLWFSIAFVLNVISFFYGRLLAVSVCHQTLFNSQTFCVQFNFFCILKQRKLHKNHSGFTLKIIFLL